MRKNILVLLLILVVVLLVAGFFITNPEQGRQVLVELGLAEPELEVYQASGMLEAETYSLSFESGGRIAAVLVEAGQSVKKGDVLATLDDTWIDLQLDVAVAQYEAAAAVLTMLEAGARDVDIAVANAMVTQAEAVLEAAQVALEDIQALEDDILGDEQEAIAQAQVDLALAGVAAAQAVLEAVEGGATTGQIEAAGAGVTAAESQIALLETQKEKMKILAPVDGMVLERLQEPGEIAAPGWPVILLADLTQLQLTVYIPEADMNRVTMRQRVSIWVDAYPDETFTGRVTFISNQAEFTPRNVQTPEERTVLVYAVKIRVPNPEDLLKPGLPADTAFEE